MASFNPETIYLKDYRPADFLIETIHLNFDLHEEYVQVKSILEMKRNPVAKNREAALRLDGEHMQLKKVYLNGELLSQNEYQVDDVSLTIAKVPDEFTLETVVVIKPQENKSLSGLYQSRTNFCTQCEAQGFRRITYYLDRPDVMAIFTTTITADKTKYPYLLSNGNLIETRELAGNRHWAHWEDPSLKPCYLFALVAGDFDLLTETYKTLSGTDVDLHLYLEKGYKDQGDYALKALIKSMQWDEQKYGREYDLDVYMIVAVSDFNMGAMENKGLNIFNTRCVLAKPETATDSDYVLIEGVIGHEYFHNWTGNRITCRDWFQLTLKEGLTVFRDQTFTEDMTSPGVARIDTVNVVRNNQFLEDAGPMAHPIRPQSYIEINNFYTMTVYRKGAEVIRMIRTLIGEENFHKAMDLYFERYDGQAVTTEDFVNVMEDASGRDLTQFKRWYDQAGTPVLDIESEYDKKQKTFTLTVKQTTPATPGQKMKLPFHLPLAVGLISSKCEDMPTTLAGENKPQDGTRILEVTEPVQTFQFINVTEKPAVSLLRGFSAPVKLKYDYSDDELLWLLQCDSDFFSRYESAQQYLTRSIFRLVDQYQKGQSLTEDQELINAFKTILEDEHQDYQYIAQLLRLPGFSYLLQQNGCFDIEAIHVAREFIHKSLAIALAENWLHYYKKKPTGPYQFNMIDAGKRAISNLALDYLTATEDKQFYDLAYQQFRDADNMTDSMGALVSLNNYDCEQRQLALDEFYDKFKSQPLVVNKWLMLQASSLLPSTLENVKAQTKNPAFDIFNPNNVYSLIGGFANNILRFHDLSGESYHFLGDQILKLDAENPQVAARILQPLTRWQQFDKPRQALMRAELERILAHDKLSSDVYELTTKSLS